MEFKEFFVVITQWVFWTAQPWTELERIQPTHLYGNVYWLFVL